MYGLPEEQESFATRGVWQQFMQADEASCTLQQQQQASQREKYIACKNMPKTATQWTKAQWEIGQGVTVRKRVSV